MRRIKRLYLLAPLAVLVAAGTSCNGAGDGLPDCDYLVLAGLSSESSAQCPGIDVFADVQAMDPVNMCMTVEVERIATGPAGDPVPPPTAQDSFQPELYEVSYQNLLTGGTRPGVDVPAPFQFGLGVVPARVPAEFEFLGYPVLTLAQLGQPPLNGSVAGFYPAAGGGVPLRVFITVFGSPVTDSNQDCSGSFFYDITVTNG
jgi:hypothetical protein